jgi:hypothetical protein
MRADAGGAGRLRSSSAGSIGPSESVRIDEAVGKHARADERDAARRRDATLQTLTTNLLR